MSSSRSGSNLIVWAVVVALGAGGYFAWQYATRPAGAAETEYRTAAVTRTNVVQMVTANGQINPVRIVEVGSQVSGTIVEINADFNSNVKQGAILAKIDPATYERALARAEGDLASSKAGLELAKFNYDRAKELFHTKLISETEFKQAEVNLHQAEANVKIREASVESAKVDLERCVIPSPVTGTVITRSIEVGQTVASSFNTPRLFTIADDLAKMRIEVAVSETDIGNVAEGQRVNFNVDAFMGRKFFGRVAQVRFAPTTNQNVVTYTTVVEVNNADLKLRPGMTANASVITSERTNVVVVANTALRFVPPKEANILAPTNAAAGGKDVPRFTDGPFAGTPMPPWMADGNFRRPTDEERAKFEASLTPEDKQKVQEMRAKMRQMMAEGGGPGGGGGARRADGPTSGTVYVVVGGTNGLARPGGPQLERRSVRLGIADSTVTEVTGGLEAGEIVVTGSNAAATAASASGARPGGMAPPFGGGGMRPR